MGYLVIDAEGYYGDYATVYVAVASLGDIPRKYARSQSTRVVSDGDWAHQVGQKIHRQDAGGYRTALVYVMRVGDQYVHISGHHLTKEARKAWTFASRDHAERHLRDLAWTDEVDPGRIEIDAVSALLVE